jgi:hypothetical protein
MEVMFQRHVGIMEVLGENCRLNPVRLRTVRPFVMKDVSLEDHFDHDVDVLDIEQFLKHQVSPCIEKLLIS